MNTPSPNGMPGMGAMNDTLDFVKKLWGGMSVPGMVVPTVSVDELQQKITDLKAVESWLNLNLTMLRNTIQALEIQRATLSTIQSMGAAMGAAMRPGEDGKPTASSFPFSGGAAAAGTSGSTGANPFAYPNWPAPAPKPEDKGTLSSEAKAVAPDAGTSAAQGEAAGTNGQGKSAGNPAEDFNAAMAAPTAWWNMLQGQFLQAVSHAMSESVPASGAGQAGEAAASGNAGDESNEKPQKVARPTVKAGNTSKAGTTRKPKA
jgi:hypothetical protein